MPTSRILAVVLGAVAVAQVVGALAAWAQLGWSFQVALNAFVVSNLLIGTSFALCGALIGWYRPRHPVGWLYAVGGNLQLGTAFGLPAGVALFNHGAPRWLVQILLTTADWTWGVHIGLVLPLSLLLLPDGRLPSRAWRPVAAVVALTAPLFLLEIGTGAGATPPSARPGLPGSAWTLPQSGGWATLWTVSELRLLAAMLLGLVSLGLRYRRGSEQVRRQLLWLAGAAAVILVAVTPWSLVAGTPIAVLFTIPLLPAAITVAVLRYGLLDIRVVLARGVVYAVLSAIVLAGYALLALAVSGVAAALLIALLALPLRTWVQHGVQRLLYGERDPLRVASRVGERLTDLGGSLEEVRSALGLPFVAVAAGPDVVAAAGSSADAQQVRRPLGEGCELVLGLRRGQGALTAGDVRVLRLLSGPLAVAVHATLASAQLQRSRERLVAAREEERLRLRRDLHDGLGPLLTGVALSADAAANLRSCAPAEADALLDTIRRDVRAAIAEVRRVVDDLRPPALADLGLAGALQARAAQTVRRADGGPLVVTVDAVGLRALPPAIEVAAYRIATEALNNAVRHSTASSVWLRVRHNRDLLVEVLDDGAPSARAALSAPAAGWAAGVGITAMRERAAELGGTCDIGPSASGGAVRARLPVAVS